MTGTRVLTNPKGRPKGVGYVTFASEVSLYVLVHRVQNWGGEYDSKQRQSRISWSKLCVLLLWTLRRVCEGLGQLCQHCISVDDTHTGTPRSPSKTQARASRKALLTHAHSPHPRSLPQEALVKALALNAADIDGRVISVERSLPRGARPAKGAAPKAATKTADSTQKAAATAAGGGDGGGGGGDGSVGGGEERAADGANNKKTKKKKKKAEGEVVVFGAGTGGSGGGIKWPVHPTTVFVRGLGISATSNDLREAFAGAGAVVEARVVEDKKTRETKVRQRLAHVSVVADEAGARPMVFPSWLWPESAGLRLGFDQRCVGPRNCSICVRSGCDRCLNVWFLKSRRLPRTKLF